MSDAASVASVMVATAAVSGACAAILWRRRSLVGARSLAVAGVAVSVWAAFYAAELVAGDLATAILLGDLKYIGICLLPPAWTVFALRYTGRGHRVNRWLLLALAVHPAIMAVLLGLPATHDLVRGGTASFSDGGIPLVSVGPLFWFHFAYAWGLLALATALIVWTLIAASRGYLRQSGALVIALLVPWVGNVVFNWPGSEVPVDTTPAAFAVVEVAMVWGVLRFRLFNLAPIARSAVIDTLDDVVIVVDPYRRVVDLNTAAERLLGTTRRAASGILLAEFLPDHPGLLEAGDERLRTDLSLARGNAVVDFEVSVSAVRVGSARVPGHVVVMRDVTEQRRARRRMEHLVHYDQLTDLPNRVLYTDRLDQALALARRSGRRVGVLFLDLDGFKDINDSLGHEVGDLVLRETAARLVDCLRETDTAARLGGDEFMIVLPSIAAPESAAAVAQKVLAAVAEPFTAAGRRVHLSASVGIAVAPPSPLDRATLGRLADAAMYRAKAAGKNRYAFAEAVPEEAAQGVTVAPANDRHGSGDAGGRRPSPR